MLRYRICGLILALPLALLLAGCQGKTEKEFKEQEKDKQVEAPEVEHHHGPHNGHVADLGDHEYLVEVTYSGDPREIRIYVLDHDDETQAAPIEASAMTLELHGEGGKEQPVNLSADPQEGEEEGQSSQFVVQGEAIPEFVQNIEHIEGHLKVQIGDETLEAEFGEHEDHEDEDHEEDEDHQE